MNERQGSRFSRKPCSTELVGCRGLWLLLLAFCFANYPAPCQAEEPSLVECHLQLLWKSQYPRVWAGRIAVVSKNELTPISETLSEPSNLSRGPLYTGGIQLSETNSELLFAPSPSSSHLLDRDGKLISPYRTEGGVGFRVKASLQDRIVISIRHDDSDEFTKPVAVPVSELLDGKSIQNQFSENAAWTLRRVDGDRLRVEVTPLTANSSNDSGSLATVPNLLWDDQTGRLAIHCDAAGDQTLELTCDLYRDHKPVAAKQRWTVPFAAGKATIDSPAWQPPPGDGSYEAVWRLSGNKEPKSVMGLSIPNAIGNPMSMIRSTAETTTVESRSQIYVISRQAKYTAVPNSEPSDLAADYTEVGRIEPFGRSWSVGKMIPIKQASQLVGVSSASELARRNLAGVVVGEITKAGTWEHGLPVGVIGRRHRIKLVVPTAMTMKLGIVLLDQSSEHHAATIVRDYTYVQGRLKSGEDDWKTISLDFYPHSSSTRIRLEDRGGSGPVVFKHVEVQQVEDSTGASATKSANHDASESRIAWLQIDGNSWLERFGTMATDTFGNATFIDPILAAERLIHLMRRNGFNGLAMTVNQDGRAFYRTKMYASDSSWSAIANGQNSDEVVLPILLQLLDREQIAFLPCVRLNTPIPKLEQALKEAGAGSIGITPGNLWSGLSLDLSLQQAGQFTNLIYNPLHPAVSQVCKQALDELAEQIKPHASVRGIGMLADQGSIWQLPPVSATMDATVLDRFYAALPPETVARSQLIGWIESTGGQAFDNWRRAQLHSIYLHAADALRKDQRRVVVLTSEVTIPPDLAELNRVENIDLVGLVRRSSLEPLAVRCRDELLSAQVLGVSSAKITPLHSKADSSLVVPSSPLSSDPSNHSAHAVRSQPIYDWSNQALLISRLLIKPGQRNLFLDANLLVCDEPVLTRSLKDWALLPQGDYEEVSFASEHAKLVKVRTRRSNAESMIVTLTNPSRWNIQAKLSLTGIQKVEPLRSDNHDRILWSPEEIQVTLAPGELLAMSCRGNVSILDCDTRTLHHEEDVVQMSETLRALSERLPMVTEPNEVSVIDNPGFETPSNVVNAVAATNPGHAVSTTSAVASAALSGWVVAQYPQDCVCWDREFVYAGTGSARLRNIDGRAGGTWMVSRAFAAPASGRISASVRLRGEPYSAPEKSQPIKVRMSIEGTVAQSNLRESVIVNVPRDGKWSTIPCRVEIDQLPACGVESLRLAIDVMNEGTVWVDEVRIADQFMTEQEQNHLQSQMYLAMGAIPKGDLMAAAKLLESHWIQELLAGSWDNNRPAILNTTESASPPAEALPNKTETPGIADRFKSWLPKPMRY